MHNLVEYLEITYFAFRSITTTSVLLSDLLLMQKMNLNQLDVLGDDHVTEEVYHRFCNFLSVQRC